jgi:hypothetical protein
VKKFIDRDDCNVKLDSCGNWWHNGIPVLNKAICALFHRSIVMDEEGSYFLEVDGDRIGIEIEDSPYFVVDYSLVSNSRGKTEMKMLISDGSEEILNTGTLWIDANYILRCRVKGGSFPARFRRHCQLHLLERYMCEESGRYYLRMGDGMGDGKVPLR